MCTVSVTLSHKYDAAAWFYQHGLVTLSNVSNHSSRSKRSGNCLPSLTFTPGGGSAFYVSGREISYIRSRLSLDKKYLYINSLCH